MYSGYRKFVFIATLFAATTVAFSKKSTLESKCEICKEMVESFKTRMTKTEKHGFGGGNTDWEESRLGAYAKSESRLLEILDGVCAKVSRESICHAMVEEHETDIYAWWDKKTSEQPDLTKYLCIDSIKVCCPENTYGSNCKECPGGRSTPCSGHGSCEGSGTRSGSGKCDCESGYEGDLCTECQDGYYDAGNNTCNSCDDSCKSSCSEAGAKGCDDCKEGYSMDADEGCKDEIECEKEPCQGGEYCVNTIGSFECRGCHESCKDNCTGEGAKRCLECKDGYVKDNEEGCKDVDECSSENVCSAGTHCQNLVGSFYCAACHESCEFECNGPGNKACKACRNGYQMEDGECKDIDECKGKDGSILCTDASEYCKNTMGGFECEPCDSSCDTCFAPGSSGCTKCKKGFKMEDSSCQDIDECALDGICDAKTEQCENTAGSYECLCKSGYKIEHGKCRKDKDSEDDEDDDHDEL